MARRLAASLVIGVLMASSASGQGPGAEGGQTPFRTGIEVVALNVTVVDLSRRPVGGLTESDFAIFENGVPQDLAFLASGPLPLDVAIVLDTSGSMANQVGALRMAAAGFVRTLGAEDRAAVIAFNAYTRELQSFTSNRRMLEKAIRGIKAGGGSSLYDALRLALDRIHHLGRDSTDARRAAIVVVTDGEDTSSLVPFADVLRLARRAGVSIYTIGLASKHIARMRGHATAEALQGDYWMQTLAHETGGQAFFFTGGRELTRIYGAIAEELSLQYTLGFVPRNPRPDGSFHQVVVRVATRPELRLRARSGYVAEGEARPGGVDASITFEVN